MNNANEGGGYLVHYDEQQIVRGQGLVKSLEDVGSVVLSNREDGTPIHIRDVGEVRFAPMIRQGAVTRDGRGEAVTGICMMLMGENARVVADRVKAELERIKPSLPPGVTIETFYDRTDLVRRTILTVLKNLSEGGLLVIVVLFLLLGNLRAGLVVAVAIPLAMFFAIDNMVYWGIAGSLMSLGAIDFGLVVDSSVIMIENCVRRLSGHGPAEDATRPRLEVVRDAAIEVRKPTMFGELIIAIVYLPILALTGMEGKLFRPMALTVIFALAGSMVLSLTLMPVLASFALRRVSDPVHPVIGWCRRHRVVSSILIAVVAVGVPLGLVMRGLGVSGGMLWHPDRVYMILRAQLPTEELVLLLVMPVVLLGLALMAIFQGGAVQEKEVFLVRWAGAVYEPVLRRVLRHPMMTFAIAAVLFGGSLWVAKDLGAEFMPKLDEGAVALQAWRLPSVALEKSIQDTTRIEQVLMAFPEVETAVSRTGRAEIATDPMGVEISDIIVMLHPQEAWTTLESPESLAKVMKTVLKQQDMETLKTKAEAIFEEFDERNLFNPKDKLVVAFDELLNAVVPGNIFSYSQPIELRVQELVAGVRSDLGISLYGDDLDMLKRKGDEIVAVLQKVPGAAEAKAQQIAGLPVLSVDVDRGAIARYGVNTADVLDAVGAIGGKIVGQVFEGQKRFALQVRFPADVRKDIDTLKRIKVSDSQGRQIPLEQLADLSLEQGPLQISRQKIRRRHLIECNVRGRDVASFVSEAQRRIAEEVDLPPGYSLHWGGQFENLVSASRRLAVVVPLALGLIFILLYSTFQSARLAGLIYLAVPMAAIGGIFALAARGMPFSISAGVGFIALFGVAVLNGLVLVSYAEHIREEGASAEEAALQAGKVRLRPVLTTALVASLGFLPMAIATSAGAEVQRPLATVVIGGLISSTLLTLLVVPAIYHWFVPGEERAGSDRMDSSRGYGRS